MPQLSIIVPTYNNENTIRRCLEAVRRSSYNDYELIVVDCGSQDSTRRISEEYADRFIELEGIPRRNRARKLGAEVARGDIVVNIDSDVVVKTDTISKIAYYFSRDKDVEALTGLLSKEHPNKNFLSQYKTLYMHYIFKKLPMYVSFLYGSIYALRREAARLWYFDSEIGEDTALGQYIVSRGGRIVFLSDLEVVHLKKYNITSFVKNEFQVPFHWVEIFLRYKGWRQAPRYKTAFAHSPIEQAASIVIAHSILALMIVASLSHFHITMVIYILVLSWLFLNYNFLKFLSSEKNYAFGLLAVFVTFLDNLIMGIGVLSGTVCVFITKPIKALKSMIYELRF